MTASQNPQNFELDGHSCVAVGRILAAAARLFAEKGFDAVSINTIAAEAGVSKANVFHHFASKQALYMAVLKSACSESTAALEAMNNTEGDFASRLGEFARAHLEQIHANGDASRLILREVLESDPARGQALAEHVINENFSRLVDILREGQKAGELRQDVDAAMVATLLVGANVFFFQSSSVMRHLSDVKFAGDSTGYANMVTEILLNGIRRKPSS